MSSNSLTHLTLVAGALISVASFWGYMGQGVIRYSRESGDLGGFFHEFYPLMIWILLPYLTFGVIIASLIRWIGTHHPSKFAFGCAIIMFILGAVIYGSILFPPQIDPQEPDTYEPNLIFLFGPLYQFILAASCSLICAALGIRNKIRSSSE